MKITFLTIFPESFQSFLSYPVIRRAIDKGLADIDIVDIKEHAEGCFRAIDDSPYGGGAGLLLRADVLYNALSSAKTLSSKTILLGPKGRKFSQSLAHELTKEEHIIFVAGHYEGVDERFRRYIDAEISIGDYILTGGETAAIVIAEAVIRLLDGALRATSTDEESFEGNLLEYPQYTHPAIFDGMKVPDVLTSGDKAGIERFNELEAIKETIRLRPDLIPYDREFTYSSLHKDYGNEAQIIRWLEEELPVPMILFESNGYIILSKLKGKPLRESGRNKILKTSAAVLKALWSLDTTGCPCSENLTDTIKKLKQKSLTYDSWKSLQELEERKAEEDIVFSHGSLTLDAMFVNGNGLTGLINLQRAGTADRYRDLASLIPELESLGIDRNELAALLDIRIDDEKLSYFMALRELQVMQ